MEYLGQAVESGWTLQLTCERRREGLKSVKPCQGASHIDLPTLLAALDPMTPLRDLPKLVRCPKCGSRRVSLNWQQRGAPRPARRTMEPIRPGELTLGRYSGPHVVVVCERCGRRGEYRTKALIEKFGPDVYMTELHERIAESRGCALARKDLLERSVTRAAECQARFDFSLR